MSLQTMESLCGSPFWNLSLTLQSDLPDLPQCFQETVLIWLPCLFLWILTPFEYFRIRRNNINFCRNPDGRTNRVPWTLVSILKVFLALVLIILTCFQLIYDLTGQFTFEEVILFPIQWITPCIQLATFILALVWIFVHRSYAIQSSGTLFMFWFLLTVCSAFTYYSLVKHLLDTDSSFWMLSRIAFAVRLISIPCVFLQWFLSCFNDSLPYEYIQPGHDFSMPTPELTAPFPSFLTFHWMNPLIFLGYSRPLKIDDLYDIQSSHQTAHNYRTFARYYNPSKSTSVVIPLFKSFAGELLTTALFKLVSCLLTFVSPVILDYLLKWMVSREPYWLGFLYAAIMFIASAVDSMLLNQYEYRLSITSLKMRSALTDAIYQKALRLSTEAKGKFSTGEIVNLMAVDAQRCNEFILFINNAWSAPLIIAVSIYLLWQQLGLATIAGIVVILLLIPLNGLITAVWRRSQQALMKEKDKRSKLVNEVFSGIKVLKLYGWEPSFKSQIAQARAGECGNLKKQSVYMAAVTFSLSSTPIFVGIFTFITYTLLDKDNTLDPSRAFVSLTLFNTIRQPMTFLPLLITFATMFFVSMKRVEKYLAADEADPTAIKYICYEIDKSRDEVVTNGKRCGFYASDSRLPPEYKNNTVYIDDGNFAWSSSVDRSSATLQDINLSIEKGSLVAIVGTVGSGKSSLLSAVLNDMVKLTGSGQVKGSIAYVPQQAWIQNATVKQNILFISEFDEAKYKKTLEASSLDSDVKILSAGDATEIGEKGINLSGGQKQRVSLARAIYSEADIYLMDDPLSAVDTHVGKHIFEKVIGPHGMLKDKTRLLVTHKVTLLPEVDHIVVMKDGRISESGSYQELLESRGAFSDFLVEYLAENVDEDEADHPHIAEMKEKMKPQLERHLSRKSGLESSQGSEHDLSHRGLSLSASNKISRRGTTTSRHSLDGESTATSKRPSVSVPNELEASDKTGRLTETEKEAVGSVPLSVYIDYFKAMGLVSVFSVLIFMIVGHGFNIAASIWLTYWSNDGLDPKTANDTSLRTLRIGVYGALGFSECIFQFLANLITFLATLKASSLLHDHMLERIMKAPMSFFDTTPQGRILNRFTKDIDALDTAIRMNFRQFLTSMFRTAVTVVVICLQSAIFLAFVVPLIAIYYFIQKFYIATSRQLKRIESTSRSPIYTHFSETVTGSTSIRAFGVSDIFIAECESRTDKNAKSFILASAASRWLAVRLEFIGSVIVLITALLAVTGIGKSNPALAGLSISYALNVTQMLNMVVRASVDLENNLISAERIIEYTKVKGEADWYDDSKKPKEGWPENGQVTFDKYSTRYREGLDLVLKGVSFKSKSAEKIGLVGRTGAGKSSITLAIFRLIEPVGGTIIVDDVDITKLGLMDLRSRITIIPQDPVLFTGSLRMNLDPFDKHTDNELWRAIELSHLKDFVASLEGGLSSLVTEGGENLSVGQRQLVCLARALLRKSKILILDEATAAVDLETDDLIQKTIRKEFAECTILTIAHRLNTIIDYDRILLLDDGKVAEFDSPRALLSNTESMFYSMAKSAGLVSNNNNPASASDTLP